MTYSERRFTVKQIKHYKDQANEFDQKAERNQWFIYGAAALASVCLFVTNKVAGEMPLWMFGGLELTAWSSIAIGIDNVRKMVGNMCRKAGLENKATELQYLVDYGPLTVGPEDIKDFKDIKGRGL